MYKSAVSNIYSKKLAKPVPIVYSTKKFATNFLPNFTLGAFFLAGSAKNYFAFWTGIDNSTGFGHTDTVSFLSATNGTQLQTITDILTDVDTLPTLFETSIVDAIGPSGSTEKILRFNNKVKSIALGDPAPAQSWLLFTRYGTVSTPPPPLNEYYYSIYIKIDPIVQTVMKDLVTDNRGLNWLSLAEMKTGGYSGNSSAGDYRHGLLITCPSPGVFTYKASGDNIANGLGIVPGVDEYNTLNPYWRQESYPGLVRFGEWLKLEIYIKRPTNHADRSTGITWMAITPISTGRREVVCNKIGGIQMGVADLPASRMFIAGQYSGLPSPIISDCAQLEMHDTFPFSAGVRSINNLFSDTTTS